MANITFSQVINDQLSFSSAYKVLKQEGNLVYEYNPFRNYRLSKQAFEYQNHIYTLAELKSNFGIILKINDVEVSGELTDSQLTSNSTWKWYKNSSSLSVSESPILRKPGELVDFETDELQFSVNHPVNILPQYSYDGSVNLILNDGKNIPRLINSRFSPLGRNKYQIVDRKGDNDTNIYDQGAQFDIDTSLYKKTNYIPKLTFRGTLSSGNLSIGNYHFYFKYMDADGNETDFIAESGLVSIFIGDEPYNINSGFRNQNSYKGVSFTLSNLDSGYQYISVYFTRATSDINQNSTTIAYKINQKYLINSANMCQVKVTGFEDNMEISLDEINLSYQIAGSVQTQTSCQNRLFLGNLAKTTIDYKELTDISLRFVPRITREDYNIQNKVSSDYQLGTDYANSYYNTKFIYNKVGYWTSEIYRLGIVYILKDNTLSPVFNIRGKADISESENYAKFSYYLDGDRNYISYQEDTSLIIYSDPSESNSSLENAKGVISIKDTDTTSRGIYGITISLQNSECITALQNMGIKGYFFVRQKRIPTTLCEAYTIGVDKQSHTPVIPYKGEYIAECFMDQNKDETRQYLVNDYLPRLYKLKSSDVDTAAICPEYDVNSPYFNTLFNGDKFTIVKTALQPNELQRLVYEDRYYYSNTFSNSEEQQQSANILAVEDNTKLAAIDNIFYSARAGEAEEAFRFEYVKMKNPVTEATNLLRGSFGPFLGIKGPIAKQALISIRIPGYNANNMTEYFTIRYNDQSPYYAISDRLELSDLSEDITCYRGDCYICQVTHRVNRNFQDPSAPTNDIIVDKKCWRDNYEVTEGVIKKENFDKINLGDVNAVQLGQWITIVVRSTMNLNIRALDDSIPDEEALVGHPRTFFPYCPLSAAGVYKIPEALCYNKGFEKSVSERYNFEQPDVPALKNDFTNRISYSDINVNDAFKNGFRTFQGTNYRDYPKTYGQITKLIEFRGKLVCIFEHGVVLIPVNERAVAGQGDGGYVYINTFNVLPENPIVLSDMFGSQWQDSIIKTPYGIYGVDTVAKKIWRTNGTEFECISDFKVQEFLNNNISLSERDLEPVVGIRNIKTHYNKFKSDIMFTFYDNLYGFEEKVWNLCYNELQQKWITFYSWVPSYSENIHNSFFSFDRNTSKWITKLGISKTGNDFSDGVCLSNNIIPNNAKSGYRIGKLSLANRTLPKGEGINTVIYYTLERDNYKNYKNFQIKYEVYTIQENTKTYTGEILTLDQVRNGVNKLYDSNLYLTTDATNLCSELFVRGTKTGNSYNKIITNPSQQKSEWIENCINSNVYCICKDDLGRRINLDQETQYNASNIVTLLNIKANILVTYEGDVPSLAEAYTSGFQNGTQVNAGYYQSVVAVIPQYNMQFLTTDFWKHGQAGIIDIADKIYPTYWYGKQHPFEFEFIVADNPQLHKIFDNLEIISNNAEPESFHYEIIGDCYEFAKDKKNMYIRQEATKELYQYNGSDILFDSDYVKLDSEHRKRYMIQNGARIELQGYDKSTLFPLYYCRRNDFNNIEDYYHLKDGTSQSKDFSALSGAEIVKYDNLQEYRICNHTKAINIADDTKGRIRGNMQYKEDKWCVQINPINLIQKNESTWVDLDNQETDKVPVELNQNPLPDDILNPNDIYIPPSFKASGDSRGRGYTQWGWEESQNKEVKIKDKWVKIRVRYKGNKLAIITAIRTLYSASYA